MKKIVLVCILTFFVLVINKAKAGNESVLSNYIYEKTVNNTNTLTICDPNDNTACLTIMDRNVGAETNDITSTGSYGYHFQWGNNHGFSSCYMEGCDSFPGGELAMDKQLWTNSYGPGKAQFDNGIFIYGFDDRSAPSNDKLRGGADDESNGFVYPITNYYDRQGPCPDGYHIPSESEWSKLLAYWVANYTGMGYNLQVYSEDNLISFTVDSLFSKKNNSLEDTLLALNQIRHDFKIPYAGGRSFVDMGVYSDLALWSSSSHSNTEFAWIFRLGDSDGYEGVYTTSNSRAFAYPIRCFKNTPVSFPKISFIDKDTLIRSGNIMEGTVLPKDIVEQVSNIVNTGYTFLGWFETWKDTPFDFENTEINEDTILYARRKDTTLLDKIKFQIKHIFVSLKTFIMQTFKS